MRTWIPQIIPDIHEHPLELFPFPAQHVGKEAEGERFEAVENLEEVPGADGFL